MMLALVALTLAAAAVQPAAERPLPFTDTGWVLAGERITIVKDGGSDVLQVETGFAHRRDLTLLDGTLDFDVKVMNRRSFVYAYFRVEGEGEREEFYLRPHKSNLPDAVQYAPVWQERSAWQLHHGPGGTAAVAIPAGDWVHVRVAVHGRRAALFVGDMAKPALLVPELARAPKGGSIALGAFVPANVPGAGPAATFANVVVRPGTPAFDLAAAAAGAANAAGTSAQTGAIVRAWSVSQAFVPRDGGEAVLPAAGALGTFTRIATDHRGLVNLHQHVRVPPGSRVSAAVARVRVRAERTGVYPLDVGFSDAATVFVNGTPVFHGDDSYSFDRPRRDGLIGFDQARVYLPLKAGDNDVAIVVTDTFGGWGIMGRFADAAGLSVEAK
jgi:hypothetical protein